MNTVTLAITLPQNGTDLEYAEAVSMAITKHAGNGIAQMALGRLLATMQWPRSGPLTLKPDPARNGAQPLPLHISLNF